MRSPRRRNASAQGRWKKIALWSISAVAAMGVVGVVVVKVAIENYLHGEGFRRFVSEKSSQTLHAAGEFEPFHFSGMTFYSNAFVAQGSEFAAFAQVHLDQVRAEVSARRISEQVWEVDNVSAQRLDVQLDGPRIKLEESGQISAAGLLPTAMSSVSSPVAEPAAGGGWLPNRVEVKSASIHEANVSWGREGLPGGLVQGIRLEALARDGGWNISGDGGTIAPAGLSAFDVTKLQLRYKAPSILVQSMELRQPASGGGVRDGNGTVRVDGEVRLGESLELRAQLASLTITPLLPPDWRLRLHGDLSGTVDARAKLPASGGAASGAVISGKLSLANGQLEALPILDQIATFTLLPQYRRLALSKAGAEYRLENGRLSVKNLLVESVGLIRIEGSFTVIDSMLDGTLQVGVPASSLQWLPGAQAKVFTESRDGYVWAPMRVSGPTNKPNEDLSERLKAAALGVAVDVAKDVLLDGTQKSKDAVKGMLDLLMPSLKVP